MKTNTRDISHFSLIDWDFKAETSRSFGHDFCWYPSRFIPIIPAYLIQALSREFDTVLDPYCGSGTTIIEGLKQNRNTIGLDLNPVACFLADTKADILKNKSIDKDLVLSFLIEIEQCLDSGSPQGRQECLFRAPAKLPQVKVSDIFNYEENAQWYHPETLQMLVFLFNKIKSYPNGAAHDFFKVLFISILIPSSGHENRKSYTYYADNVKPKEKLFKNALLIYAKKLKKFLRDYPNSHISEECHYQIINDDIRNLKKHVAAKSVDLIVTSPPYFNVTDYTTAYRLAYLWGLVDADLDHVKKKEIGARWRRRAKLGMKNYLDSLVSSISDMTYTMKDDSYLCLIFGGSKKYGSVLKQEIEGHLINGLGLELVDYYSRNISRNFFLHPSGGVPTEDIVILRK